MLERAGEATVLRPEEVTPSRVAAALRRVLNEPRYAAAARRTANEIAAMPDTGEVASALRKFAVTRSERADRL